MPDRRTTILVAAAMAGLAIAGLVVPGKNGGSILLLVTFLLIGITTATAQLPEAHFRVREWVLRVLIIMVLGGIAIVKLFSH